MVLLAICVLAAVILLLFCGYCYKIAFYVPKKRKEDIYHIPDGTQYQKWGQKMVEIALIMQQARCEELRIQASDGTVLFGRYYGYFPGAPVILAFHGYRSMAFRDDAGAFALSQKLRFNILAVDQRSHGASQGSIISFGVRERHDCRDWAHYASHRFGPDIPILLCGVSMGAATVLMASDLDLPANVVAVMADCPYSSPAGIIGKVAKDMGYPERLALPFVRLSAKLFGMLDIDGACAYQSVQQTKLPVLLIHGEDDRFIPCDMSRQIYESCSGYAELHTFPDAGHGLSYIVDPRRYEKICVEFLWRQTQLRPWLAESALVQQILHL